MSELALALQPRPVQWVIPTSIRAEIVTEFAGNGCPRLAVSCHPRGRTWYKNIAIEMLVWQAKLLRAQDSHRVDHGWRTAAVHFVVGQVAHQRQ